MAVSRAGFCSALAGVSVSTVVASLHPAGSVAGAQTEGDLSSLGAFSSVALVPSSDHPFFANQTPQRVTADATGYDLDFGTPLYTRLYGLRGRASYDQVVRDALQQCTSSTPNYCAAVRGVGGQTKPTNETFGGLDVHGAPAIVQRFICCA